MFCRAPPNSFRRVVNISAQQHPLFQLPLYRLPFRDSYPCAKDVPQPAILFRAAEIDAAQPTAQLSTAAARHSRYRIRRYLPAALIHRLPVCQLSTSSQSTYLRTIRQAIHVHRIAYDTIVQLYPKSSAATLFPLVPAILYAFARISYFTRILSNSSRIPAPPPAVEAEFDRCTARLLGDTQAGFSAAAAGIVGGRIS